MLLLPALTVYLGLDAGGYFAGTTGEVAVAVAAALAVRIAVSPGSLESPGRPLVVATVGLALFAIWSLLSGGWSGNYGRALIEFDRVLLYLLVLVLFGSIQAPRTALRYLPPAFGVAAVFLCAVALATRTLPDLWPYTPATGRSYLAYPVTYSNGLGILAALGIVTSLHTASWDRERAPARVLAAGALPLLAATLVLTRSDGAIVAGAIGALLYIGLGRPRGLLTAVLGTVPFVVLAAHAAGEADLLAAHDPTTPAALDQGRDLARAVGLAILGATASLSALIALERRLARVRLPTPPRRALQAIAAVLATAVVGAALVQAAGGPRVDVDVQSRDEYWEVAIDAFEEEPITGTGVGTFADRWTRGRPIPAPGSEAHSLYLETLGELGAVGVALIAVVLATLLASFVAGLRGVQRPLHAVAIGAAAAWLVHAGLDWDWELPAVTVWLFAFGGCALAAWPRRRSLARASPLLPRILVACACVVLAATPAVIAVSQSRLDGSVRALLRGDCEEAERLAASASTLLSVRAEPYEILAYCASRRGEHARAISMMQRAIERDPHRPQLFDGLALIRAAAGLDPREAARKAVRLDPLGPRRGLAERFATNDPRKWRREARQVNIPLP